MALELMALKEENLRMGYPGILERWGPQSLVSFDSHWGSPPISTTWKHGSQKPQLPIFLPRFSMEPELGVLKLWDGLQDPWICSSLY